MTFESHSNCWGSQKCKKNQYMQLRNLGSCWGSIGKYSLHVVYSLHSLHIVLNLYKSCVTVTHTGISPSTSKVFASCTSRTTPIKDTAQWAHWAQLLSSSTWLHELPSPTPLSTWVQRHIKHKLHKLICIHCKMSGRIHVLFCSLPTIATNIMKELMPVAIFHRISRREVVVGIGK